MGEQDRELIRDIARQAIEEYECQRGACPLGITAGDARALGRVVKLATWAGAIFAGTVIMAFATGFIAVIVWAGRLLIAEMSNSPP